MNLSWVFDLVHTDPDQRRAALSRHHDLLAEANAAQQWINRVRAQAGSWAPTQLSA
jgi:hypothetical protein